MYCYLNYSKNVYINPVLRDFEYLTGFGSHFSSVHPKYPDALPIGQNSPQKCAYGLYAEQLSGTAFTAPRTENARTWFYRIRPSVVHKPFMRYTKSSGLTINWNDQHPNPNQMRWNPFDVPSPSDGFIDFVQGINTICGAGDPKSRHGLSIHIYACNSSMIDSAFYNGDGDFLIGKFFYCVSALNLFIQLFLF